MATDSLKFWIDTHVHIYPMYDIDILLDCAYANFSTAISNSMEDETVNSQHKFALFMTEGAGEGALTRLQEHATKNSPWNITQHSKTGCLIAAQARKKIIIVPGQQLVSHEGIEVLVVNGERRPYSREQTVFELLTSLENELAILPWGFGKWLGSRGKTIIQLLKEPSLRDRFILGDIPARLNCLGGSAQFKLANDLGYSIIRGVDPLPLQNEQDRIGSFGSCISLPDTAEDPSTILCNNLMSFRRSKSISHFGKSMSLFSNLKTQSMLRFSQ